MKIVHLADLHLGYRAYYRLDPHGFNLREMDVLTAFREALRKIAEINPDLIIIAGDVFHKPRPSNLTIFQTIHRLAVFRSHCKAPIVIISGNHECVKTMESGNVLNIIERVIPDTLLVDGDIKELEFKNLDTLVVGVPYNALGKLKDRKLIPDKQFKYNILSIHGSYDSIKCPELSQYGNEELLTAEMINQRDWDYIAMGHYHSFTELESNAYYSGSIERTSTNIWKEAKEDKGFIEYDLDKKECKFHTLESPRKVVDIKKIDATNLTAEDINLRLDQEVSKIPDFSSKIVRITLENVDPVSLRGLDYKKIRQYKKQAVQFRLNIIKKDVNSTVTKTETTSRTRKGLLEYLEDELKTYDISHELNPDKFIKLAKQYLLEEVAL